ncbi:MAG: hypothetical protein CMA05_04550 [Euryarchaeota archaeon]|nr:hypothetical protein [Euryarchaeota archaeon]
MNQLEREQMINGTSERLATLIFEKVERAYFNDAQRIDVPTLTNEIFGLSDGLNPNLIKTPEFNAVCNAIDFLIEEDIVWFDTRDGTVHLV